MRSRRFSRVAARMSNRPYSFSRPLVQDLFENGGFMTMKSNVSQSPAGGELRVGDRVAELLMPAVALPCRIMFILHNAQVALSFSWP